MAKTMQPSKAQNARAGAYEVLSLVEEGAYANLALDQYLEGAGQALSRIDRNFLVELVQGTIKYKLYLDWIIDQLVQKSSQLKPGPRNLLRLGFYQLCFMDRVPPRAATNETVNLAKIYFHSGVASLINGVMRNWLRDPQKIQWPDEKKSPAKYLSVVYSHPLWLVEAWLQLFSYEQVRFLCEFNNQAPPLCLRANTLRTSREGLMASLQAQDCQVSQGQYVPEAVVVASGPAIRELEAFQKGWFIVQDESSMLVAHGLAPRPGDRVLDACAAPGGKTTHLAQLMENQGEITAWDIHEHRVGLIKENSRRLGVNIIKAQVGDATKANALEHGLFDRILVDAPCSGLGVLRRRADARWRKSPEEIVQLAALQKEILRSSLGCLAVGGRLVYSTCTIMPEENEAVVRSVLQDLPGCQLTSLPFGDWGLGEGSMLQCLPFSHNLEGFFLAAIERKV